MPTISCLRTHQQWPLLNRSVSVSVFVHPAYNTWMPSHRTLFCLSASGSVPIIQHYPQLIFWIHLIYSPSELLYSITSGVLNHTRVYASYGGPDPPYQSGLCVLLTTSLAGGSRTQHGPRSVSCVVILIDPASFTSMDALTSNQCFVCPLVGLVPIIPVYQLISWIHFSH